MLTEMLTNSNVLLGAGTCAGLITLAAAGLQYEAQQRRTAMMQPRFGRPVRVRTAPATAAPVQDEPERVLAKAS